MGIEVFTSEVGCENFVEKIAEFLKQLERNRIYIIQEGIEQHKDFQKINASSVNTLRMITQWQNEKPVMSACALRMGRDGKDVDNNTQGGISCQINENDGSFNDMQPQNMAGAHFLSIPIPDLPLAEKKWITGNK